MATNSITKKILELELDPQRAISGMQQFNEEIKNCNAFMATLKAHMNSMPTGQFKQGIQEATKALKDFNAKYKTLETHLGNVITNQATFTQNIADMIAKVTPLIAQLQNMAGSAKQIQQAMVNVNSKLVKATTGTNTSSNTVTQVFDLQTASVKELETRLKELKDAWKNLSAEQRKGAMGEQVAKDIAGVEQQLERSKNTLNILTSKNRAYGDSLNELRRKLSDFKKQYDNLSGAMRNSEMGKKLENDIKNLTKTISEAEQKTGRFQRNVGNYSSALNKGFRATVLNVIGGFTTMSQALVALGKQFYNGISTAIEYHRSVSKLAAICQTTAKGVNELTAQARLLGSTTRYTASEVVALQTELAKLGYTQDPIIRMTKSVIQFAQATGSELADAAQLAGAALRIFNLETTSTNEVVDKMAKATTSSALSFDYIKTALPIVGGAAETFGFKLEDTLALLGQLANSGMDASMAATATRNIFLKLADSNGVLAKELGRPVKTLKDLTDGLRELRERGANLNDVLEMTSVRAAVSFTRFLDGAEAVDKLKNSIVDCDGAAAQMAKTMEDNLGGDITRLKSAWEEYMIALNGSQGILRNVVNWLVGIVTQLGNITRSVKDAMNMNTSKYVEEYSDIKNNYMKGRVAYDIAEYKKEVDALIAIGKSREEAIEMAKEKIINSIYEETEALKEQERIQKSALESYEKNHEKIKDFNDDELRQRIKVLEADIKNYNPNNNISVFGDDEGDLFTQDINELKSRLSEYKELLALRESNERLLGKIGAQSSRLNYFDTNTKDKKERGGIGAEDDAARKAREQKEKSAEKARIDAQKEMEKELLAITLESEEKRRKALDAAHDQYIRNIEYHIHEQERLLKSATSKKEKDDREAAIKYWTDALTVENVEYQKKLDALEIENANKRLETLKEEWKQRLEYVLNGSNEEFDLRLRMLNAEEEQEINSFKLRAEKELMSAEHKEAMILDIQKKYQHKRAEEENKFYDSQIQKEVQHFEERMLRTTDDYTRGLEQAKIHEQEMYYLRDTARQKEGETNEEWLLRKARLEDDALQATKRVKEEETKIYEIQSNAITSSLGAISAATEALGETDKNAARIAKAVGLMEVFVNQGIAISAAVKKNASEGDPYTMAARIAAAVGTIIASMIPAIASINKGHFAKGVVNLQGAGTETSDSIPAMLSRGESVMTAKATQMFGGLLAIMNKVASQPTYTLPTQYSMYNPAQTSATNEQLGESMRQAVSEIHPVVSVTEINEVGDRLARIKVLDTI